MVPHVHGDLCHFLTHPSYGRHRQANLPRSFFKTYIATVGLAIWLTLPDEDEIYKDIFPWKGPNARGLIASNVIDNAAKMLFKIRQEWMSNERLKAAFPELIPDFNKTRWSDHVAEVKRTIKSTEGTYTAAGVGGSVISQHFDYILEDDLIYARKDDFNGSELMPSQEDIDNAIGWHKLAFSLFANPKTSCLWNTGTRWAPRDLIHYIRKFEPNYSCFEMAITHDAAWPILEDSQCVWPERYPKAVCEQIFATQGPRIAECFPAEAPILMANWEIKPIKDVCIGDVVVGFTNGSGVGKGRLEKATVNLVEHMQKAVVKVTLASGKVIRCTADHPWYTGRKDKSHAPYLPAKVGRNLLQVYDCHKQVTAQELLDYRYLAGIIDGEGACSHGNIAIGQSQDANPDVYQGIEDVLRKLNIPYRMGTVNPNETHILRNKTIARGLASTFVINGGRQIKGDILRFGKPAKAGRILGTIWECPHGPIRGEDTVVSIIPDGVETVHAIGTTTGNYVAYGFATKNTQYLNRPRANEDIVFRPEYINIEDSFSTFPIIEYKTIVDLAGWDGGKGTSRNVILTGGVDGKHHLWVARIDVGRFNPTEVMSLFRAHSRQFKTDIWIEEIQYQRALSHFSKVEMERTGEFFMQHRLPHDGRAGAKDLRIMALEPVIANGALHILPGMRELLEEVEFYPHSKTKDILDCLGYLFKIARPNEVTLPPPPKDPFSIEEIEREIKAKIGTSIGYPFDFQLEPLRGMEVVRAS